MSVGADLMNRHTEVEDLEERIAASRILSGPFELQIKYEARLLNNLRTLGKEYAALQQRDRSWLCPAC